MTEIATTQPKKAKKSKADAGPKPRRFTQRLACDLTEKECLAQTQTLVQAMQSVNQLIDEKRELVSLKNANIKVAQDEVNKLAASCRSGKEERDVECYEEWHFPTNTATIYRADTKAKVGERVLAPEERQASLPGIEAPKPGAPLTATVREIAKKRGRPSKAVAADLPPCPKVFNGEPCVRGLKHKGTHGYKQGPKAN